MVITTLYLYQASVGKACKSTHYSLSRINDEDKDLVFGELYFDDLGVAADVGLILLGKDDLGTVEPLRQLRHCSLELSEAEQCIL